MQNRHLLAATAALDCATQLGRLGKQGEDFTLDARITRLTPRLVSLHESAQYYCGGAHPDDFDEGVTLDCRTGRAVSLDSVWPKLTPGKPLALYLDRYPAGEAECRQAVQEGAGELSAKSFTGWLTAAGLILTPTFLPHAAAVCARPLTLSYAELRPQASLTSSYFRELYARWLPPPPAERWLPLYGALTRRASGGPRMPYGTTSTGTAPTGQQ